MVRLELWSQAKSLKTGTHHNHLGGFQDDALTSTPQAACWSFAKTGKKKKTIILTKCWVKIQPKKNKFVAFLSSDFLTPKRINRSFPPQITQTLNRQHGRSLWNVQQSSIEKTVPPFSWDHFPLKEKTRLWKGPLSWHHNLYSIFYLWWRGKERILRATRSKKVSHESNSHGKSELQL